MVFLTLREPHKSKNEGTLIQFSVRERNGHEAISRSIKAKVSVQRSDHVQYGRRGHQGRNKIA